MINSVIVAPAYCVQGDILVFLQITLICQNAFGEVIVLQLVVTSLRRLRPSRIVAQSCTVKLALLGQASRVPQLQFRSYAMTLGSRTAARSIILVFVVEIIFSI